MSAHSHGVRKSLSDKELKEELSRRQTQLENEFSRTQKKILEETKDLSLKFTLLVLIIGLGLGAISTLVFLRVLIFVLE